MREWSTKIFKLIEKNLSFSQLIKKHTVEEKETYGPVITVSRETGSGGRLVAQKVAKKLGIKYYDKKIINLIVEESDTERDLVKALDEKANGFLHKTIRSLFGKEDLSGPEYYQNLVKVLLTLMNKGNCLILGRGGNFVIPDEYGLKIRIVAPLKTRIENSIKYEGKTRKEAFEETKEIHFQRKDFIRRYFGKDISNANYYHLVINTKNIELDQAVKIIVKAFKEKFS